MRLQFDWYNGWKLFRYILEISNLKSLIPPSSNLVWGIAQSKIICFLQCASHMCREQMNRMRITNLVVISKASGVGSIRSLYPSPGSMVHTWHLSALKTSCRNQISKCHRIKVNHDVGLAGDVESMARCLWSQVAIDPLMLGCTLHCSYKLVVGYTGYVDKCPLMWSFRLKRGDRTKDDIAYDW